MAHMLFDRAFSIWHEKAGVFSAQPGAPVVPDDPTWFETVIRRLRDARAALTRGRRRREDALPAPSSSTPAAWPSWH